MSEQRRFQVVAGYHVGKDGEVFGKGDFVESDKDLARSYPGKFVDVSSPVGTRNPKSEELREEVKKSKKKGKKSKLQQKVSEKKQEHLVDEKLKGRKPKTSLKEKLKSKEKLGKNETKKHEIALEKSLLVYKNDQGKFNVATESDPLTPVNESPLNRAKLSKFLSDWTPVD